jgi:hypothetical protein
VGKRAESLQGRHSSHTSSKALPIIKAWTRTFTWIIHEELTLCRGTAEEALKKSEKQIPRGLNFTPISAKTALVGDPCSPARDDNNRELNGAPEGAPLQSEMQSSFSAASEAVPLQSLLYLGEANRRSQRVE